MLERTATWNAIKCLNLVSCRNRWLTEKYTLAWLMEMAKGSMMDANEEENNC